MVSPSASQEILLEEWKEARRSVGRSDRQNVLYVVKKQLVLKNTGRFVQEHNCSSDEAISEPGI